MFLAQATRKSRKQTRPDQPNEHPHRSDATNPTTQRNRLFLVGLGLGLLLRTLLPDTNQTGVRPRLPQSAVGTALDTGGDLALGDLDEAGGKGLLDAEGSPQAGGGLGGLLVLGGIGLLGLVGLAGEENEASLVVLQALDIGSETLLREVLAAVVDSNADGGGKETGNASSL